MEKHHPAGEQASENQADEWIQQWSSFILQSPFSRIQPSAAAQQQVQRVLQAVQQGDSCLNIATESVLLSHDLVADAQQIQSLPEHEVKPFIHEDEHLYLYRYWRLEQLLAEQIMRMKAQTVQVVDVSAYQELLTDPFQQQALHMVAEQSLSLITGGPGTGKTYTLARIIAVLSQALPDIRIALAAPTGKAAQRMKEALHHSLSDQKLEGLITDELKQLTPVTIHRLLGMGNTQRPRFHAAQPLPYDVVVVDEASMLDLNLAQLLFSAVPSHARLILLGDAHQLASVDVGSVLADLQQSALLEQNRTALVTSRRFSDGARIGQMAKFIQQQNEQTAAMDVLKEFETQVVSPGILQAVHLTPGMQDMVQLEYLPEQVSSQSDWTACYDRLMMGYSAYQHILEQYLDSDLSEDQLDDIVTVFDQYRILTAVRHGALGLYQLNRQIEKRLLDSSALAYERQGDWYSGRPVMMTYNDYQLGLSNGDIGLCLNRRKNGATQFEVYFPALEKWTPATRLPKNVETAFALTIHKSQGSEFSHVAVVLDRTAKKMLSRELIYTAITRAKNVVSLLADKESLVQSIRVRTSRTSGLLVKINKLQNC